jgi:hypothetical protein
MSADTRTTDLAWPTCAGCGQFVPNCICFARADRPSQNGSVQIPSDQLQETQMVIGIEAIKALYVNGGVRVSSAIEALFNGDKAALDRIAAVVGHAATKAMRDECADVK